MNQELDRATAHCEGVRYTKDGGAVPATLCIINQHVIEVQLNGAPWRSITCSPTQLKELVLGRLATEGLLCDMAQVVAFELLQGESVAQVTLAPCAEVPAATGGCPAAPAWQPEWVFALQELLAAEHPLYQKTHGCHSCTIAKNGEVLYICEDISRHNALDKAIGCAVRDGVDIAACMVYSSGRAPYDMLQKAIAAGVRCYVSKAVPTAQGVALAKQAGITLITNARGGSFTVVTKG